MGAFGGWEGVGSLEDPCLKLSRPPREVPRGSSSPGRRSTGSL